MASPNRRAIFDFGPIYLAIKLLKRKNWEMEE
jgi:hypothetical protein